MPLSVSIPAGGEAAQITTGTQAPLAGLVELRIANGVSPEELDRSLAKLREFLARRLLLG